MNAGARGGGRAGRRAAGWSGSSRACSSFSHLHYSVRHSSLPVDLHAVLPWTAVELTADVVEWSTPFLIFLGLCGHFASRLEKEESKVPLIGWLFFLFTCFFGPSSSEQALFYRLLASGCTLLALIYDERRPFEPKRKQMDEWRSRRSATPAVRQNGALRFRTTEPRTTRSGWTKTSTTAVQLPDLNGEREKKRTPARELTPFSELSFRLDGLSLSGRDKQPIDFFTSFLRADGQSVQLKKATTNPVKPFELRVSQPQWPRPMFSRFAACSTPVDGSPASSPPAMASGFEATGRPPPSSPRTEWPPSASFRLRPPHLVVCFVN
ncbi:hypothetical protein M3Y99_01941700 [Aphelenchoides fujianensis]|nr:hypothetical protein M3Y99_01941700 [Aphelenchoides fujianensis]